MIAIRPREGINRGPALLISGGIRGADQLGDSLELDSMFVFPELGGFCKYVR